MKFSWKGPIKGGRIITDGINNLPSMAGVYIWKRAAPPCPEALTDSDSFVDWWGKLISPLLVSTPTLSLKRKFENNKVVVRKDFFQIRSITVGGRSSLTEKNQSRLLSISQSEDDRESHHKCVQDALEHHGSVLYVGESDNLSQRIWAHAKGNTGLVDRLNTVGLELEHMNVFYAEMPDSSKAERTFIEETLCYCLLAPLSFRPG